MFTPAHSGIFFMRLSVFITEHMGEILAQWDEYALRMTPAAENMTLGQLRDHAESMLRDIAKDMETTQTAHAQLLKSQGTEDNSISRAATKHGHGRQGDHFTLLQLSAEFRALRATVLRMWLPMIAKKTPARHWRML